MLGLLILFLVLVIAYAIVKSGDVHAPAVVVMLLKWACIIVAVILFILLLVWLLEGSNLNLDLGDGDRGDR